MKKELHKKLIYWIYGGVWRLVVTLIGAILLVAGIAIWVIQIYGYLRFGNWTEFPLLDLVSFLSTYDFAMWLCCPTNWIGLQKIIHGILDIIPLSLFLIVLGGALTVYSSLLEEDN